MPLALIGAIGGLAGTALQIAGNKVSQNAMNSTRAKEVAQQKALQQQSTAVFQKSLKDSTPANAATEMQAGQNSRMGIWGNLQNATTPVASALPATATGSPTSGATARSNTAANTWNTLNANAAAKEGSYGDWENQQNIKNANASQQLGVINNFSQGDANLLPVEMQVASQKGAALSGWGSIVSSLGSLAGLAGATGAFAPALDANGVPLANNAAAIDEFNGAGAARMAGSGAEGFLPSTLPAVNDSAWENIYA